MPLAEVRGIARLFGESFEKFFGVLRGAGRIRLVLVQPVRNLAGHGPADGLLQAGPTLQKRFD